MTPHKLTCEKNKYLKCISVLLLIGFFFSCGKKSDSSGVVNNNEIKATVLYRSGATVNIIGKAEHAIAGCAPLYYTFLEGINETNAAVYVNVSGYGSGSNCVTSPSAYVCYCEYRENTKSTSTPIYVNRGPGTILRDSITFTICTSTNIEGYFKATCWYGTDTVFVSGTFKADKIN